MNVALIRGPNLNKFEMQNYEPLRAKHSLCGFTSLRPNFDIDHLQMPVRRLLSTCDLDGLLPNPLARGLRSICSKFGYNEFMVGLENELENFDIAHAAEISNGYSLQAVRAKKKFGLKVILTVWENIPLRAPRFRFLSNDRIKAEIIKGCDLFVSVSERAKTALILEGADSKKIEIIPMGVDVHRFRPSPKDSELVTRYDLAGFNTVVLFVGRLVWSKGIYDLIYAAKVLCEDSALASSSVKFVIAGRGRDGASVHALVKALNLSSTVDLIGDFSYHDIDRLYSVADIFVLPSIPTRHWQEQFGMVLVEAMACGKAIVSTLSGSIPEVIGDAGILVQPNDPLSLAGAIKKLIVNRSLRLELQEKARELALMKADAQKISTKIDALYQRVGK